MRQTDAHSYTGRLGRFLHSMLAAMRNEGKDISSVYIDLVAEKFKLPAPGYFKTRSFLTFERHFCITYDYDWFVYVNSTCTIWLVKSRHRGIE